MIKTFGDDRTEKIFRGRSVKRLDQALQRKALRRLRYIDAAVRLDDLRIPPSNKLERKSGDLSEYYAIWVNTQWRIIFKWNAGDAYDVRFLDYH